MLEHYDECVRKRNQTAIKVEISMGGASLVICDRPMGEMHSSPVVCSSVMTTTSPKPFSRARLLARL